MSESVQTRLHAPEVRELILGLVAALAGRTHDYAALVRGIKLRVGLVVLGRIQEAFIEKARGGTGEDGVAWDKLKPETIAARRVGPGDRALLKGIRDKGGSRPYLTDAQDKRWRLLFATRRAWFMGKFGMSEEAASAHAAQVAWATLKSEGAKTKLQVLGSRQVEIGRDTGRLFASLSPGLAEPASLPLLGEGTEVEERILRDDPGAISVGSNVVYAGPFHKKRPLWPPTGELPRPWADAVAQTAADGIMEAVVLVLQQAA